MAKILWIEDEAKDQLIEYLAPLIHDGHVVDIAEDATEAYYHLLESRYEVIIFDLLIKSGADFGMNEQYPGLALLRRIFKDENNKLGLDTRRIMIFSVVTNKEIVNEIKGMGIENIRAKERMEMTRLKTFVDDILKENGKNE